MYFVVREQVRTKERASPRPCFQNHKWLSPPHQGTHTPLLLLLLLLLLPLLLLLLLLQPNSTGSALLCTSAHHAASARLALPPTALSLLGRCLLVEHLLQPPNNHLRACERAQRPRQGAQSAHSSLGLHRPGTYYS